MCCSTLWLTLCYVLYKNIVFTSLFILWITVYPSLTRDYLPSQILCHSSYMYHTHHVITCTKTFMMFVCWWNGWPMAYRKKLRCMSFSRHSIYPCLMTTFSYPGVSYYHILLTHIVIFHSNWSNPSLHYSCVDHV